MKKRSLILALVLSCAMSASGHAEGSSPMVPNGPSPFQISPIKTVATLPTCNAGAEGFWSAVSDATTPTYNGTLTGGSTVHVPVYCNGTAWTSH